MEMLESVEKKLSPGARVLVIMPAPRAFEGPSADLALPWLPAVVGEPLKPLGTRRYCFMTMDQALSLEKQREQEWQAAKKAAEEKRRKKDVERQKKEWNAVQKKGDDDFDAMFG